MLKQWQDDLEDTMSSLVVYGNCSINNALSTKLSDAQAFFKSKSFDGFKKDRESKNKLQVGVINGLNNVIRAINVLIKRR